MRCLVTGAAADTTRAREYLSFTPTIPLRAGLTAQVTWQRSLRDASLRPVRGLGHTATERGSDGAPAVSLDAVVDDPARE